MTRHGHGWVVGGIFAILTLIIKVPDCTVCGRRELTFGCRGEVFSLFLPRCFSPDIVSSAIAFTRSLTRLGSHNLASVIFVFSFNMGRFRFPHRSLPAFAALLRLGVLPTALALGDVCPGGAIFPDTISTCNRWHTVVSGDSCWDLWQTYGITETQFVTWNPSVSNDCLTSE